MVFQMPRFIRRMIRRRMHPMAEHEAWDWKTRLSVAYAIIAWHAGGFVLYQCFVKDNKHWPTGLGLTTKEEDEMRPATYFAGVFGVENAKVVRVSGLSYKVENLRTTRQEETSLPAEPSFVEARPDTEKENLST